MVTAPSLVNGVTNRHPARVVERELSGIHLHPLWAKHNVGGGANRRPVVNESPLSEMHELISISPGGTVLKGFQTYERAKQRRLYMVECIEYPIAEKDVLIWILENSTGGAALNDFLRIIFALEATTDLLERARHNQSLGGKPKLLTNLSEAQPITYRKEVARIANVSERNVDKVRQLLEHAVPDVIDALSTGTVSIHRAWLWLGDSDRQLEFLRFHLGQYSISTKVDRLHRSLPQKPRLTGEGADVQQLCKALGNMAEKSRNEVFIGDAAGPGIFLLVSRELRQRLERQGELIL